MLESEQREKIIRNPGNREIIEKAIAEEDIVRKLIATGLHEETVLQRQAKKDESENSQWPSPGERKDKPTEK